MGHRREADCFTLIVPFTLNLVLLLCACLWCCYVFSLSLGTMGWHVILAFSWSYSHGFKAVNGEYMVSFF